MVDTTQTPPAGTAMPLPSSQDAGSPAPAPPKPQQPRRPSRMEQLNKLYALPAPLRTFPLPTFVPHNPLSLFHILYVWAQQTVSPPSSHFEVLYRGYFSPDTRSVHVIDLRSVRGLWEQGFYGKGSLSRSEPSWLDREMKRRGEGKSVSSEEVTRKRRAERQQVKWERARKEREAIDLTLAAEAETEAQRQSTISPPVSVPVQSSPVKANENASDTDGQEVKILAQPFQRTSSPPVDPLRLLSLPNSSQALRSVPEVGISRPPIKARSISGSFAAPVGPLEILALPDSTEGYAMLQRIMEDHRAAVVTGAQRAINGKTRSRSSSSSSINSITNSVANVSSSCDEMTNGHAVNGHVNGTPITGAAIDGPLQSRVSGQPSKSSPLINATLISEINGIPSTESTTTSPTPLSPTMNVASLNGSALVNGNSSPEVKRRKSVRFSPTVEHTTFITTEPPSPERAAVVLALEEQVSPKEVQPIRNQEHYQLTLEEAFFLSYSLGALTILSPDTNRPIQNSELFSLFRRYSYFPLNSDQALAPDDPFLLSYVVYHHFRSLGWIVRGGTKFSVDYLLYLRGPVFTHAEFAVLILPSYSAPYWSSPHLKNYVMSKEKKSWSWLHCVNRVITQVKKTLILVYVDIPEPVNEQEMSIDTVLGRYKVREIVLKRWASNRSRD